MDNVLKPVLLVGEHSMQPYTLYEAGRLEDWYDGECLQLPRLSGLGCQVVM